jgi:hypothetical protein
LQRRKEEERKMLFHKTHLKKQTVGKGWKEQLHLLLLLLLQDLRKLTKSQESFHQEQIQNYMKSS